MVKSDLLKPLSTIINQLLHTGILPDKLKIAKVILFFKKGDSTPIENYRPISLLPAISNIFERVIFNQMNNYFTLNNFFYDKQYRFCKYHSTELADLNVVDTICCLFCCLPGFVKSVRYTLFFWTNLNFTVLEERLKT